MYVDIECSSEESDKGGYEGAVGAERGRQDSVSLNRNVTARYANRKYDFRGCPLVDPSCSIQNPLAGIPRATLLKNVEDFAAEVGMVEHTQLIQKGALVAQDPPAFEQIEELDEVERDALRNEVLHKWRQHGLSTSPSSCAPLAQLCRGGIKPARTAPISLGR